MFQEDSQRVLDVVNKYFQGIFKGDIALLEEVFHPQAQLFGDVQGKPYYKGLPEYLEGVQQRQSPYELGEPYCMTVRSIEIVGAIAYATLLTPMFGLVYRDYLALCKTDGTWLIVNKIFTNDTLYAYVGTHESN